MLSAFLYRVKLPADCGFDARYQFLAAIQADRCGAAIEASGIYVPFIGDRMDEVIERYGWEVEQVDLPVVLEETTAPA